MMDLLNYQFKQNVCGVKGYVTGFLCKATFFQFGPTITTYPLFTMTGHEPLGEVIIISAIKGMFCFVK